MIPVRWGATRTAWLVRTRLVLRHEPLVAALDHLRPRLSGRQREAAHSRLRQIDEGTLTLTTKRLIFDGTHENRNVQLSEVMSVSPWADAIEVSTERRAKSQIYQVKNPLIWASMIEAFAAGRMTMRTPSREEP